MKRLKFSNGGLVEVRSMAEIAQTLDAEGKLEGLPFMPEMASHCGARLRLLRKIDRTCVVGLGFRRIRTTVLLEGARCDGAAHDGCQRACLMFWKEAWLKPVDERDDRASAAFASPADAARWPLPTRRGDRFVCQSTELHGATEPLSRWSIMPFLRDLAARQLSPRDFLRIVARTALHRLAGWSQRPPLTGTRSNLSRGNLDLQSGEWVDVKTSEQLRENLDAQGGNCGLIFQPTMTGAVGGRFQVAFPVRKIIVEQTGKMVSLKHTVALKNVHCEGVCVANCPRREYLYWRESWLSRVPMAESLVPNKGDPGADPARER